MFFRRFLKYSTINSGARSIFRAPEKSFKFGSNMTEIKYLTADEATDIDKELMGPKQGFATEQLVELAGLAVAHATTHFLTKTRSNPKPFGEGKIVCVSGPGLNGADGITAARHLKHYGYDVLVVYPKPTDKEIINNLLLQCKKLDISVTQELPKDLNTYDLVLDAIFGFSFKGDSIREPFDKIIEDIVTSKVRILSVDIPSGWDVEKGRNGACKQKVENPDALISLTAPKTCAKQFDGEMHFVGGRFVPHEMQQRYQLNLPKFEGVEDVALLNK
ncbi:NAD(P)H-hydrate epimerase [Acrasis kona]|uniref:NAD(P)H-hydrate epimerase n=1 Tax=Acrasis kona TaxID=1008807 RepID=A0AAW2ZT72_9EUKA